MSATPLRGDDWSAITGEPLRANSRLDWQPMSERACVIYRTVLVMMLAGLLWKVAYFWQFLEVYRQMPLEDAFFPVWARSCLVLGAAYASVVIASGVSLVTRKTELLLVMAGISCGSLLVLNVHQGSYNDMTFLTAFWASIWSVWFVYRAGVDTDRDLVPKAAWLANLILAMILLGGGIGKWTSEYWSGQVLFEIYFRDRDFWLFNGLREVFSTAELREVARWYSRLVVVMETGCFAALWLLPRRWGALLALCVFGSIALLSNWFLFSVVLSTMGLATVGLHDRPEVEGESEENGLACQMGGLGRMARVR